MLKYIKNVWITIWLFLKKLGSWRGVLSFLIVWLVISGSGLIVAGVILNNLWLIGLGTSIYAFWLLPLTPLIPVNLILALIIQRYVFRDKRISYKQIKEELNKIYKKQEDI